MSDFDVQQALEAYRAEMQTDRLALQQYIATGFDKLAERFEAHNAQDHEMFADHARRLGDLEILRTWLVRFVVGVCSVVGTSLLGLLVSRLF